LDVGERLPLVWPEPASDKKKIEIAIGSYKGTYDITSIGKQKAIKGAGKTYYHVWNIAQKYGKEITVVESEYKNLDSGAIKRQVQRYKKEAIEANKLDTTPSIAERIKSVNQKSLKELEEESRKEFEENFFTDLLKKEKYNKEDIKLECAIMGVGLSIIDNEPKELIYLSAHEIYIGMEKDVILEDDLRDTNYLLVFNVGHVQIDNMLNKSFPVIFGPQALFMIEGKMKERASDWAPFIQIQASINEVVEGNLSSTRCNTFQMQFGEMAAFLDLEIIMNLMTAIWNITGSMNARMIPRCAEENRQIEYYPAHKVFINLDPSTPQELKIEGPTGKMIFIEFMNLAALKLKLSLRLEKTPVDPTGPLAILQVLYSVVATLSNISDAPMYFSEIIMKNTYTQSSTLQKALMKKYTRQGILQFYRLLGSIDLIGNPIGLLDRIGSGVFEFFNEPRKGLLKGPKEFAQGLGKGFKSLITNVVGGSLNSVSRVTGSLYSLTK